MIYVHTTTPGRGVGCIGGVVVGVVDSVGVSANELGGVKTHDAVALEPALSEADTLAVAVGDADALAGKNLAVA